MTETNQEFALALELLPSLAFEAEKVNSYNTIVEENEIVCNRIIKEAGKTAIV